MWKNTTYFDRSKTSTCQKTAPKSCSRGRPRVSPGPNDYAWRREGTDDGTTMSSGGQRSIYPNACYCRDVCGLTDCPDGHALTTGCTARAVAAAAAVAAVPWPVLFDWGRRRGDRARSLPNADLPSHPPPHYGQPSGPFTHATFPRPGVDPHARVLFLPPETVHKRGFERRAQAFARFTWTIERIPGKTYWNSDRMYLFLFSTLPPANIIILNRCEWSSRKCCDIFTMTGECSSGFTDRKLRETGDFKLHPLSARRLRLQRNTHAPAPTPSECSLTREQYRTRYTVITRVVGRKHFDGSPFKF